MATICLRRLSSALLLTTLMPVLARPVAAGVDRWTPIGPEGGEILSLAADPDSPGTLYAGTYFGGVWKSLDGGGSWAPTVEGLGGPSYSALAVSNGRVLSGGSDGGLYVLADGASAWRRVGPFPFGAYELAVDPTDPAKIWAIGFSSGGDLYASNDAGESWDRKLSLQFALYSVDIAPTVPPTVWVGGGNGLYTTRDGGASWHEFDIGSGPPWSAPFGVGEVHADPEAPETVFASASSGFWRTTDAGGHWSQMTDGEPRYRLLSLQGALLGFNGSRLLRSEDKGDTWEPAELGPLPDIASLVADPAEPGGAWLGSRGSIFRTSDSGRTWTRTPGRDLRATFTGALAFDPFRPGILYTTLTPFTYTGKLLRSVDDGASWSPTLPVLDVSSLVADPRRPATLYVGTPRGVAVSRDRGVHWQRLLQEPKGIDAVAVDPHRTGTLWAAGRRFWRSRDAGRTWKRLANPIAPGTDARGVKLFPSPWHPETLYLIDSYQNLRRSTDGGATWEALDAYGAAALAFDPVQPDLLYVADTSGNLRKSLDGGTAWEPVANVAGVGVGLTALLIDCLDPSIFYAGTAERGVWRSLDRGATWQPLATGFFAPRVTCLEADPRNPRRLVACTLGGGLLEIRITSGS